MSDERGSAGPSAAVARIRGRNAGLDFLKACAITAVVLWHGEPIHLDPNNSAPGQTLTAARTLAYLAGYDLLLFAVPVFMMVSLYLFIPRAESRGWHYSRDRVLKIVGLYLFWLIVQFALVAVTAAVVGMPPLTPWMLWWGGPDLFGEGTVLWFLRNLALVTAFGGLYVLLPRGARTTTGVLVVGATIAWFAWSGFAAREIPLNNVLSFMIYVPVADLLVWRSGDRSFTRVLWAAFALTAGAEVLLRVLDLVGRIHYHVNDYARVPAVLGAAALVSLMATHPIMQYRPVEWVAQHSLGIYAVHRTVLGSLRFALPGVFVISVIGVHYNVFGIVILALTVALTVGIVYGLSLTPLRRFTT